MLRHLTAPADVPSCSSRLFCADSERPQGKCPGGDTRVRAEADACWSHVQTTNSANYWSLLNYLFDRECSVWACICSRRQYHANFTYPPPLHHLRRPLTPTPARSTVPATDGANSAGFSYLRIPLGASDFSASREYIRHFLGVTRRSAPMQHTVVGLSALSIGYLRKPRCLAHMQSTASMTQAATRPCPTLTSTTRHPIFIPSSTTSEV